MVNYCGNGLVDVVVAVKPQFMRTRSNLQLLPLLIVQFCMHERFDVITIIIIIQEWLYKILLKNGSEIVYINFVPVRTH